MSTVTVDGFDASQIEADVSQVGLEHEYNFALNDAMLRKIVAENRKPTFSELTFFKSKCGFDQMAVNTQIRRMSSVMRLQSVVGSTAQREAALNERNKSAEILSTEGAKLDDKIAKLTEQKAALERAASQAEKRFEQIQIACDELQKLELLRSDLQATYTGLKQQFGGSTWSEMNALGVEIQFRELLVSSEINVQKLEHIRSNFRHCIEICQYTRKPKLIGFAWEAQKEVLRQELEEMRPKFEALRAIREEQEAQLDELKTHYIKENG